MRFFVFVFLFFYSAFSFSQERADTVFFMNGEIYSTKIIDTSAESITCLLPPGKKKKTFEIETERIFSVRYADRRERIYYFYDTMTGNFFTIQEMRMFILGEQEAVKNFRSPSSFILGFVAGAASPLTLANAPILAPVVPFAISGTVLLPKVRVKTGKIADKNYLKHDTYILGYERIARKKKIISALKGSLVGLTAGFAAYLVVHREVLF